MSAARAANLSVAVGIEAAEFYFAIRRGDENNVEVTLRNDSAYRVKKVALDHLVVKELRTMISAKAGEPKDKRKQRASQTREVYNSDEPKFSYPLKGIPFFGATGKRPFPDTLGANAEARVGYYEEDWRTGFSCTLFFEATVSQEDVSGERPIADIAQSLSGPCISNLPRSLKRTGMLKRLPKSPMLQYLEQKTETTRERIMAEEKRSD